MVLEDLLKGDLTKKEFFYTLENYQSPIENWNNLASDNAIHAAVSAKDENEELKKSQDAIGFLKKEMVPGYVLDLGCGYGRIEKYLLPSQNFSGWFALDSSVNMLNIFHNRYINNEAEKQTPVLFINSDINNIPIKSDSVDNVIVSAVHLHNPKKYTKSSIDEVFRVLKKGGKMINIGNFPNSRTLMGLQGNLYLLLLKLLGKEDKNGPVRYFNKPELKKIFKDFSSVEFVGTGFQVVPKGIIFFPDFINKIYKTLIFKPITYLADKIFPKSFKKYFFTHHDLIAIK